jgi:DNA-binding response OmpR family regulator
LALEALIKREDRTVYKAQSADEALSLLLQHEFAMAILDVQMPGMNGFELAELMRGTGKPRTSRSCFVSAAGRELNYAFKGYESGAVDFLHKPLDIHAVKSKVNVFVELFRQSKAMKQQVEAWSRAAESRKRCFSNCRARSWNWSKRCACAMTSCQSSPMKCARRSTG